MNLICILIKIQFPCPLRELLPYFGRGVFVSKGSWGLCCQGAFAPLVGFTMANWS